MVGKRLLIAVVLMVFLCSVSNRALAMPSARECWQRSTRLVERGSWQRALRTLLHLYRQRHAELGVRAQVKVLLRMTALCLKLGKRTAAHRCLRRAKSLAPHSAAVTALANRCLQTAAKEQLPLSTRFGTARTQLDFALFCEEKAAGLGRPYFVELKPVFHDALAANYRAAEAHYGMGLCLLFTEGANSAARSHLLANLALAPTNAKAHCYLAQIARECAAVTGEVTHLEQCIALGLANNDILHKLLRAYAKRRQDGDHARALPLLQSLVGTVPETAAQLVEHTSNALERQWLRVLVSRNAANGACTSPSLLGTD